MKYKYLIQQLFVIEKAFHWVRFAGIPALLFYGISLLVLSSAGLTLRQITTDPAQTTGESSFLGFVSNVGFAGWVSAAAIVFFCALNGPREIRGKEREMLILIGILSLLLAIDDFFMIHDRYIDQKLCYLTYAGIAAVICGRHLRRILDIDGLSFFLAGFFLGSSILVDLFQLRIPFSYRNIQVFEEGLKFIGIVTWLYWSCRIAANVLTPSASSNQRN